MLWLHDGTADCSIGGTNFDRLMLTHELALEAYEEHHVFDQLLAELGTTPFDSEEWGAKLTTLQENVEQHIEEEEGELFREASKVLSIDQIGELAMQMVAVRKERKRAVGA